MKTENVRAAMLQVANIAECLAGVYEAAAESDDLPPKVFEKLEVLNASVLVGAPFVSNVLKESLAG